MTARPPGLSIWLRPEGTGAGRPARRSRAQITLAAIAIADGEGIEAVSMRRVAADLGTGAASLYRYVDTREDLLDLMIDFTGAEYVLAAPTGKWLADLIDLGLQARAIMRRHRWLADLVLKRQPLGPHGLALLQHVLEVLEPSPASIAVKLDSFALLTAVTAVLVQAEVADSSVVQRNTAYLQHAVTSGEYPRLGELLAAASPAPTADPADRYSEILGRILSGLLGPGAAG